MAAQCTAEPRTGVRDLAHCVLGLEDAEYMAHGVSGQASLLPGLAVCCQRLGKWLSDFLRQQRDNNRIYRWR